MMRTFLFLPALFAVLACSASEGETAPSKASTGGREFAASGFDRVVLRGPDDIIVTTGPNASVRAEGDHAALEKLEVSVRDGTLIVGRVKEGWFGSGVQRGKATVKVTMPAIRGADIAGSGDMTIDRVATAAFETAIAGSGSLDVASLETQELGFSIAGSGDVRIGAGKSEQMTAAIAGSGNLDLTAVNVGNAKISIVGSGDVKANVSDHADVTIIGAGDVEITGGAECKVSKMGAGDVRC